MFWSNLIIVQIIFYDSKFVKLLNFTCFIICKFWNYFLGSLNLKLEKKISSIQLAEHKTKWQVFFYQMLSNMGKSKACVHMY